ncbi:MAG: 50S ribosomal protein L32, partial [Clostridiales Family XIII bacterium]|nr:50S ribosomal protein L32 [Clostridiales Family XIII bacterium]
MAVPKRKTSKAKRDSRRAPNMRMTAPGLSLCPQCHSPKLPHRV